MTATIKKHIETQPDATDRYDSQEQLAGVPQLGEKKVKGGLAAGSIKIDSDEKACRICLDSAQTN
jgi:hypothetical protein